MGKELSFATPDNKKTLSNYVDTITTKGSTQYVPALRKAFDLLNTTASIGDKRTRGQSFSWICILFCHLLYVFYNAIF